MPRNSGQMRRECVKHPLQVYTSKGGWRRHRRRCRACAQIGRLQATVRCSPQRQARISFDSLDLPQDNHDAQTTAFADSHNAGSQQSDEGDRCGESPGSDVAAASCSHHIASSQDSSDCPDTSSSRPAISCTSPLNDSADDDGELQHSPTQDASVQSELADEQADDIDAFSESGSTAWFDKPWDFGRPETRLQRALRLRDEPCYEGAQLTSRQMAARLMQQEVLHHRTNADTDQLCRDLANCALPQPNNHPQSRWMAKAILDIPPIGSVQHHMCAACELHMWSPLPSKEWIHHKDDRCPRQGCGGARFDWRPGSGRVDILRPKLQIVYMGLRKCIRNLMQEPGWAALRATGRNDHSHAWRSSPEYTRLNEALGGLLDDPDVSGY